MQSIWQCFASELLGASACARHSKNYTQSVATFYNQLWIGLYQNKLGRVLVAIYDPDFGDGHVEMLGEYLYYPVIGGVPLGSVTDRDLIAILGFL